MNGMKPMNGMKTLTLHISFFLLLLLSVSFAQSVQSNWTTVTAISLVIATSILALLYMIGRGFNIQELKLLATEEFYQIILIYNAGIFQLIRYSIYLMSIAL